MVTYLLVRPELDRILAGTTGGPDPKSAWTKTEILAHRYSSPDPVQRALLRKFHRYSPDPSAAKTARLTKSRNSFRFGKNKTSGTSRSSTATTAGKTIAVRGHSHVDELDTKLEEVLKYLTLYEDAVRKQLPEYFFGVATIILENVIHLSRDVDQIVPNTNSSEVSSLMARMNQSIADLVLWNDQYYLYGDAFHSTRPINDIVTNVRQSAHALVDFVINKENQNISNEFFHASENYHNETNGFSGVENSPHIHKKMNTSKNSLIHGSMPEIFHQTVSSSNGTSHSQAPPSPVPLLPNTKLAHSVSSDSILDSKDGSLPHKSVINIDNDGSCISLAPPIPPKLGSRNRHSSSNDLDCPLIIQGESVLHPSHRLSAGSMTSNSEVSPASSHDSMTRHTDRHFDDSFSLTPHRRPNCAEERHSGSERNSCLPVPDLTPIMQDVGLSALPAAFNDTGSYSSPDSSTISSPSNPSSFIYSGSSTGIGITKSYYSQSVHINLNESTRSTTSISSSQVTSYSGINSNQHLVIHRKSRSSTGSSSSRSSGSEADNNSVSVSVPPPIPIKKNKFPMTSDRDPLSDSGVDTVDYRNTAYYMVGKSDVTHRQQGSICSTTTTSSSGFSSSKSSMASSGDCEYSQRSHLPEISSERPPLPRKTRHVMEYMETFKHHQMPEQDWFLTRRSQQIVIDQMSRTASNLSQEFKELDLINRSSRLSLPAQYQMPPSLPPKQKSRKAFCQETHSTEYTQGDVDKHACPCQQQIKENNSIVLNDFDDQTATKEIINNVPQPVIGDNTRCRNLPIDSNDDVDVLTLLDHLQVDEDIDFKKTDDLEVPPVVKAGKADALLVYATYCKDGQYLEAFLTTYRTFFTPTEIIAKLFYRYHKFICSPNPDHQKASKNAFSLLVRVVHDLVLSELSEQILKDLSDFEYNLLSKGDLKLGLYFRNELSDKLELLKIHKGQYKPDSLIHNHSLQNPTLLGFKSRDIANQMTLLDAESFNKVGVPELLHYSREQNEDLCPNLTLFAKQINNMSSWVKTQILQSPPHDREKYYKQFIKIMKHLRKVNNFNSCMAILSGLESPAISRLEWKTGSVVLKEYGDLFAFDKSYCNYRHALTDTKPPCIPHLGINLQDLTKVHNANPNNTEGKVNFLKRMLQFKILEDMKRFIPSKYKLEKMDPIINFLNKFENCMTDDALWELSHSIKP